MMKYTLVFEDEIISILDVYNMQDRLSAVKDWYDGYLFGDREVYNPWSALQFIDDAKNKHDYHPISYWPILQVIILSITSSGSQIQH